MTDQADLSSLMTKGIGWVENHPGEFFYKIGKENKEQKDTTLIPSEHLINLAQGHNREINL
jgi:hypothetical protein